VQWQSSRLEDDKTEFMAVRFLARLAAVHIETTRRVFVVDTRKLPEHFGLKFWAQPMERNEEFVAAYADSRQRPRLEDALKNFD